MALRLSRTSHDAWRHFFVSPALESPRIMTDKVLGSARLWRKNLRLFSNYAQARFLPQEIQGLSGEPWI